MYRGELLNFFQKKVVDCFGSLRNSCTFAPANEGDEVGNALKKSLLSIKFFDMIP